MKKLLCLLLAAAVLLSLSACGGESASSVIESEPDAPLTTVNIADFVTKGQIPEIAVGLDGIMGDVRAAYMGKELSCVEADYWVLASGPDTFYVNKSDFGVTAIVTSDKAFGIPMMTDIAKITEFMGGVSGAVAANTETPSAFTSSIAAASSQAPAKSLIYKIGNNDLEFLFTGDKLVAVAVYEG